MPTAYFRGMRTLAPLIAFTLLAGPTLANVPAAYLACEDKGEGDPCRLVGPSFGECVLDTLCEDTPEIEANECLLCVDSCWGKDDGAPCLHPLDNTPGVCELQDRCTDREETSFAECNRCVRGAVATTEPDDCSMSPRDGGLAVVWALILGVGWRQWRRG